MPSSPEVTIVILNWNNAEDTLRCLASVEQLIYPNYEVIVVDNGSVDDSVSQLRTAYPSVTLLETGENLGYTGGNNAGILYALASGADYIWLLNDDATVAQDSLSILVNTAQSQQRIGFLGPLVLMREEPRRILSAGGNLARDGHGSHRGLGETDLKQFGKATLVDYAMGCALLVSRELVEVTGMLDDDFFAYHEEIDWCYRGRQAGFSTLFVPSARVWHPDTLCRDQHSLLVTYYIARNRLLFLRKHSFGLLPILRDLAQDVLWIANWSLNPKWRAIRSKRNALVWAITDFLLGRFGRAERPL